MEEKEEKETPIKVENNDAPVSTVTSPKSTCRASRHRLGELSFRQRSISRGLPNNAALVVGFRRALFCSLLYS
jgi:hypothetical protein